MLVLKLQFKKGSSIDIRRIPSPSEKLSFLELRRIAVESFHLKDNKEYIFQYKDETDVITFTNDLELEEGLRFSRVKHNSEDENVPFVFFVRISLRSKQGAKQCPFQLGFENASSCCKKIVEKIKEKRSNCLANQGSCGFGNPLFIGLKIVGLIFLLHLICHPCILFPILFLLGICGLVKFCCRAKKGCGKTSLNCPIKREPIPVPQRCPMEQPSMIRQYVQPESKIEVESNSQELPFQAKLRQLEEMGFTSRTRNIEILIRNGGDVLRSVKNLLDKHN